MPKVGDKHFSYSAKGKKAAKAYAEKTGQSVKKYYGGGSVDPFSTKNPEGVPAEQVAEAMEKQNMAIPTTNAMDRSQTSPDTEQYKDGGKVEKTIKEVFTGKKDITDVVKTIEKKSKKEKAKADEIFKEHTLFGRQFKKGVS